MKHFAFPALALASLAACSGGGSANGSAGASLTSDYYAQLSGNATQTILANPNGIETLPTSGSATVRGMTSASAPEEALNEFALGEMEMNLDFADATFTGKADNFAVATADIQNQTVNVTDTRGSLETSGTLAAGNFGMNGSVSGELELPSTGLRPIAGDVKGTLHEDSGSFASAGSMDMEDADGVSFLGTFILGQ